MASCATTMAPETVVKLNEQYGHLENGVKVILLPDHCAKLVELLTYNTNAVFIELYEPSSGASG